MISWKKIIIIIIVLLLVKIFFIFSHVGTVELRSNELGNNVPYFIDSDGVFYFDSKNERYINKSVYILGKKKVFFCEGLGPECRDSINYLLIIPLN
ncbi:MAG: hypothetical protein VX028_00970 [Nanoarchaeota archaeon]|nr:hypothetical protein [Nanoarchaeota archaeon]